MFKSASGSYVSQNTFRNLFWYDDEKGLVPDLAESCARKKQRLECRLKKDLHWSDGRPLTAADFVASYRRLVSPSTKAPRSDLLFPLKNADQVLTGALPPEQLGVSAPSERTLVFELEKDVVDFESFFLPGPLSPIRTDADFKGPVDKIPTSGAYRFAEWKKGQRLRLAPRDAAANPELEFLFVEEDSVAVKLYEKNELDFLRRLPTLYIPRYQDSKEFHWIPVIRFDSWIFGPALDDFPEWREALAISPDYEELRKIFHSEGRPGCSGVPPSWLASGREVCLTTDTARAKKLIDGKPRPAAGEYIFSAQGGEDHRRAAEWQQNQWRTKLGWYPALKSMENKIFVQRIQSRPPTIYRKGISADRPDCRSVVEVFSEKHPDRFISRRIEVVEKNLQRWTSERSALEKKKLCEESLRALIDGFVLIPTGRMHFSILARPRFTGWKMNGLGQLDLSRLRRAD